MKKILIVAVAVVLALCVISCSKKADVKTETEVAAKADSAKSGAAYHIGIVTGSVSQSEDNRRGAEVFQQKYGEDMVKLAIYPDNFTEELETTIQTIVNLSDDPLMKAIIVNQGIPGTTEAVIQIINVFFLDICLFFSNILSPIKSQSFPNRKPLYLNLYSICN